MTKSITTTRDENCTEYQQNTKLGIGKEQSTDKLEKTNQFITKYIQH